MADGVPLKSDAVFRLASLTKPIAAAAALTLVDEGAISLDDPIAEYLPEFGAMQKLEADWLVQLGGWKTRRRLHTYLSFFDPYKTAPAERPITVRHLLSQQGGVAGVAGEPLAFKVREASKENHGDLTLEAAVKKLAEVPLLFEPGDGWFYGEGYEIIGRLIEAVSGKPLGDLLQERIFSPLGMVDSTFFLQATDRLPTAYLTSEPGKLTPLTGFWGAGWTRRPQDYLSAGWGLNGTAEDYSRFCRMLLQGGELDGTRVLSEALTHEMTSNQIGDRTLGGDLDDFGYGFGLRVRKREAAPQRRSSPGSWGWYGHIGTYFWGDPEQGVAGVILTQKIDGDTRLEAEFQSLVREMLSDANP